MDRYPTQDELDTIKNWDVMSDPVGLIDYIKGLWHWQDRGFFFSGKRALSLELHTGGWSGNESIIDALASTMFWTLYWQESMRGGHYKFRIKLREKLSTAINELHRSKEKRQRQGRSDMKFHVTIDFDYNEKDGDYLIDNYCHYHKNATDKSLDAQIIAGLQEDIEYEIKRVFNNSTVNIADFKITMSKEPITKARKE